MIAFGPTEEQELVRDAMRAFAADALRPLTREVDEADAIPDELLDTIAQLGLVSTQLPEACGGGGEPRSPITNALVLEELAHGDASVALAAMAPAAFANAVVDLRQPCPCCAATRSRRRRSPHSSPAPSAIPPCRAPPPSRRATTAS
jgi:alkylation response protein AidB-like acyl-CoA dehydrogenase